MKTVGLVAAVPKDDRGVVNFQMKTALDKIAFLPFGRLMDQWRWDVFSGKVPEGQWNARWWELRRRYQGVDAPVARSEKDFDPGAKYHIPANVPYALLPRARLPVPVPRGALPRRGPPGPAPRLLDLRLGEPRASGWPR